MAYFFCIFVLNTKFYRYESLSYIYHNFKFDLVNEALLGNSFNLCLSTQI